MLKKIYRLYLLNYKGIHHLFTLSLLFTVFYLTWGFSIFREFFICSLALALNFYLTNWCIRKSGIEEVIEEEISKLDLN